MNLHNGGFEVKHFSNKPFFTTLRDSLIATSVSLAIVLIVMFMYYHFLGTPDSDRDWKGIIIRGMITTISTQFVYEYLGVNNMLAESSMRYARGSTLSKYTTRKSAMVHQVYYETLEQLIDDKIPNPPTREEIEERFTTVKYLIENPQVRGKLSSASENPTKLKSLLDELPEHIQLVLSPITTHMNLDTFIDRLTETQTREILLNGFSV